MSSTHPDCHSQVIALNIANYLYCQNSYQNRVQRGMGMLLFAAQAPKRVMTVMCKLGVCQSYQTIRRNIRLLAKDAQKVLSDLVKNDLVAWALLYDNINWLSRVKIETSTKHGKTINAIIGNIILLIHKVALPSPDYPMVSDALLKEVMGNVPRPTPEPQTICPAGLRSLQRLPAPTENAQCPPVDLKDFLPSKEREAHLQTVMVFHLASAFIDANPKMEGHRANLPPIPAIYPLHPEKSQLIPVPLQNVDESEIDGQPEFFDLTLRQHLGLPSDFFKDLTLPTYGDAFTTDKIRSAKQQFSEDLTRDAFSRFGFPATFFGPFHLSVSLGNPPLSLVLTFNLLSFPDDIRYILVGVQCWFRAQSRSDLDLPNPFHPR
jgi:hypothetical protein